MRIAIRGHHLPGRRLTGGGCDGFENVHVGVQELTDPVGLVPGDAGTAAWDVDVKVVTTREGALDFRGPAVHGRRGERFLYLTWGNVTEDGSFEMFRRAKLMLDRIDPALVRSAEQNGRPLRASIDLTDSSGLPRCARVDPPAITWALGA